MNDYKLLKYDYDSSKESTKDKVYKYVLDYLSKIDSYNDDSINQILGEISTYEMHIYIAYDGDYSFGIMAFSKRNYLHHRILNFIYLENEYCKKDIYNELFDSLIETYNFTGLAIIANESIPEEYLNAGFFKSSLKNPDKLSIYLRSKTKLEVTKQEQYCIDNFGYMNYYIFLYKLSIWSVPICIVGTIIIILIYFLNETTLMKIFMVAIILMLLLSIFVSKQAFKNHNNKGEKTFGFKYSMVYINTFEYKFEKKDRISILYILELLGELFISL